MGNNTVLRLAVVAVVVGCVTCGCKKRTLLNYNVGLTPTVTGYDERQSAVVDALDRESRQADFVCLQEVWFEEDMKTILDRLGNDFRHHYSAIHHDVDQLRDSSGNRWSWVPKRLKTVPCNILKLLKLLTCFGVNCLRSGQQQRCMVEQCRSHMYGVSQACRTCISMASTGPGDVMAKCGNIKDRFNRVNPPGLLVLSKRPLTNVQYMDYHDGRKVLVQRGYIKAQVEGDQTYICTHLTSVLPDYYDVELAMFSNYKEMQAAEINKLYTEFSDSPHVLMGDLNTGPARSGRDRPALEGEVPANYEALITALHYQNPYMLMDGRCTYCRSENPVLRADGDSNNDDSIIDHVLISRGVNANVSRAKRMFDQLNLMLSDHFGIELDLCLPRDNKIEQSLG